MTGRHERTKKAATWRVVGLGVPWAIEPFTEKGVVKEKKVAPGWPKGLGGWAPGTNKKPGHTIHELLVVFIVRLSVRN